MRLMIWAAAALLGLSGAGQAATITYKFDLVLDQFFQQVSPVPGDPFLVPVTPDAPWDQGGTLVIDTDIHPVVNSTLSVSSGGISPVKGISGDWLFPDIVYGVTTLNMTFDTGGNITDWSIRRFGRAVDGIYSPTATQLWLGSFTALGPEYWNELAFGKMPDELSYFTTTDYWTASQPGTWTRVDAVAVPLPAASVLLIAGLGCLGATRMARYGGKSRAAAVRQS